MTAAAATANRRRSSSSTSRRPQLRVLNQQAIRQRARHRNALLALFLIVILGFFAVAFVHAQLVSGQRELDELLANIEQAEADRARLSRAVEEASSPAQVVKRAELLGMVRAAEPIYLSATVPAGQVAPVRLGSPTPPGADPGTVGVGGVDGSDPAAADLDTADLTAPVASVENRVDGDVVAAPAPATTTPISAPGPASPISAVAGSAASSGVAHPGPSAGDNGAVGDTNTENAPSVGAATGAVTGTAASTGSAGNGAPSAAPSSIAGSRAVAGGSGG